MTPAALVAAPLVLATVLAVGGIAKLRDDDAQTWQAWAGLGVPDRLNGRALRRAHPWAEVVLAALLVTAPGALGVTVAAAGVGLCAVYLLLVARAAARPEPALCDCFGSGTPTPVTGRTVARNVVLLLLALGSVAHAIAAGSPWQVLAAAPASTWWWLAAVAVAALTTHLVDPQVPAPSQAEEPTRTDDGEPARDTDASGAAAGEPAEYLRTLTPITHLVEPDGGTRDLVSISATRAQLLVFVSPRCGGCLPVAERVPAWQERMPAVQLRLVVSQDLARLADLQPSWVPYAAQDVDDLTARALRVTRTPTAVLLGTDGMLAGGPVVGYTDIEQFVADVAAELDEVGA